MGRRSVLSSAAKRLWIPGNGPLGLVGYASPAIGDQPLFANLAPEDRLTACQACEPNLRRRITEELPVPPNCQILKSMLKTA